MTLDWYMKATQAANRIDPAHTSPWKLVTAYSLLSIAENLARQHKPAHPQPKPARGERTISAPNGEILTLAEVAEMTRQKPSTLRWWRAVGEGGPKSFKLGRRVLYRRAEVEEWIAEADGA